MIPIYCYCVKGSRYLGVVRNQSNTRTVAPPAIIAGRQYALHLRLFDDLNDLTPHDPATFANVTKWSFAMDNDYDQRTPCKITAHDGINAGSTTVDGIDCTEVVIPLRNTLTMQLLETFIENGRSAITLTGELVGKNADGAIEFLLQIKGFEVSRMVSYAGYLLTPPPTWTDELTTYLETLTSSVDNTATSAHIPVVEGGKCYEYRQGLTALTVDSVAASYRPAKIVFRAASASDAPPVLNVYYPRTVVLDGETGEPIWGPGDPLVLTSSAGGFAHVVSGEEVWCEVGNMEHRYKTTLSGGSFTCISSGGAWVLAAHGVDAFFSHSEILDVTDDGEEWSDPDADTVEISIDGVIASSTDDMATWTINSLGPTWTTAANDGNDGIEVCDGRPLSVVSSGGASSGGCALALPGAACPYISATVASGRCELIFSRGALVRVEGGAR